MSKTRKAKKLVSEYDSIFEIPEASEESGGIGARGIFSAVSGEEGRKLSDAMGLDKFEIAVARIVHRNTGSIKPAFRSVASPFHIIRVRECDGDGKQFPVNKHDMHVREALVKDKDARVKLNPNWWVKSHGRRKSFREKLSLDTALDIRRCARLATMGRAGGVAWIPPMLILRAAIDFFKCASRPSSVYSEKQKVELLKCAGECTKVTQSQYYIDKWSRHFRDRESDVG